MPVTDFKRKVRAVGRDFLKLTKDGSELLDGMVEMMEVLELFRENKELL